MGGFSLPVEDYGMQPSNPADELLRRQQEEALAQHKAYAEALQEKQAQVHLRGEDLDLSKRLLQATDPSTPKPVRDFLLKGISASVGVDPKGEYSQQLTKMIGALDPQSLEMLRKTFGVEIPGAPPGKIKEGVKGIFTGAVPVTDLLMKVNQTGRAMAGSQGDPSLVGGPKDDRLDASKESGVPGIRLETGQPKEGDRGPMEPRVTPTTPGAPAGPTTPQRSITPTAEEIERSSKIRRYPTVGETLPADRQAEPRLLKSLGVDPTQELRNRDLVKDFPGIPRDTEGQNKLADRIDEQNAASGSAVMSALRLHNLFRGRPETLGIVGGTVRTIDQVVDQINGAARALGATNVDASKLTGATKTIADKIMGFYASTGLEQTAETSARIQSAVLEMAYDMAVARGIPGNRLTNAIISQHLQTIGSSASVAQFEAVLKDVVQRSLEQGGRVMSGSLGAKDWFPGAQNLSDSDIKEIVQYAGQTKAGKNSVVPDRYLDEIDKEIEFRKTGKGNLKKVEASSPTLAEEQEQLARSNVRREMRDEQTLRLAETADERAQSREQRAAEDQIFQRQKEAQREAESERRFKLQEQKEARAAEHQRRQEIMQAFARIGATLAAGARGGSVAGGNISAPEQDTSAFRVTPPPQRRAPSPGGRGGSYFDRLKK